MRLQHGDKITKRGYIMSEIASIVIERHCVKNIPEIGLSPLQKELLESPASPIDLLTTLKNLQKRNF